MVMGQKYMGKLQKYCDARKRLRRVKGQWSEVDLSQSQCVFFVKALTNLHLVILFPYISLLLFHIYIYRFLILWVLRFLETETPTPCPRPPPPFDSRCAWPASASGDCVFQGWYVEVADPSSPDVWIVRVDLKSKPLSEGVPHGLPKGRPHGLWLGVKKKQQTGMPSIPTNFHHSPGMSYCYYMLSLFGVDCRYRQVVLLCADYMLMKLVAGRYQNRFVCFFFRTYLVFPVLQNPIGNTFLPNM